MALIQTGVLQGAGSLASATGTMTSAVNASDLMVAFVWCAQTGATLSGVTDTEGNSYGPIQGPISGTVGYSIWVLACLSTIGGLSGNQITCTFTAAVIAPTIGWAEFSGGYNSQDGNGNGSGASGTNPSVGCTTTQANDVLVGFFTNNGQTITPVGATQLFTGAGGFYAAQYATASGAGSQTQAATQGAPSAWAGIIAAFKMAPPGPPAGANAFPLPVYKAIGIF